MMGPGARVERQWNDWKEPRSDHRQPENDERPGHQGQLEKDEQPYQGLQKTDAEHLQLDWMEVEEENAREATERLQKFQEETERLRKLQEETDSYKCFLIQEPPVRRGAIGRALFVAEQHIVW